MLYELTGYRASRSCLYFTKLSPLIQRPDPFSDLIKENGSPMLYNFEPLKPLKELGMIVQRPASIPDLIKENGSLVLNNLEPLPLHG